jgi:riboflavin kinase/FMN adenylyltransferase
VVGYDFHFGQNRSGDIETLQKFCAKNQIHLIQVPPFEKDGEIVSSSYIRESLKQGHIKKVNELLGRPFYLHGLVEKGFARGRQIGIPTANISFPEFLDIKTGVYATRVVLHHKKHDSVTNIGLNPTFEDGQKLKVETHIFNFSDNIYGESIRIELHDYIREEKKFSKVEDLIVQIQDDIKKAKQLCAKI